MKSYTEALLEEKKLISNSNIIGFSIKEINGFFKSKSFPSFDSIKYQLISFLNSKKYNNFFRRALARAGYAISRSTLEKDIYKTNAPMDIIFDVLKGWRNFNVKLAKN